MPRGDNNRKITRQQAVEALRQTGGRVTAAAKLLGVSRNSITNHRSKALAEGLDVPMPPINFAKGDIDPDAITHRASALAEEMAALEADPRPLTGGRLEPIEVLRRPLPKRGTVATYIVTGAVNNTDIHQRLWANIKALAAHYGAEILVRPIFYNLNAYRRMGADTENVAATEDDIHFDPAVLEHFFSDRIELAPGLHLAGDAPVTATAANPLSGYQTFTGEASGIFAATKIQLESVATMKHDPAKMLYTTGVVTQRNYTETKTGQKADWHHSYGALLVEVDSDGDAFVRHLLAGEDGTINDLGLTVRNGRVRQENNVAALTPGDVHVLKLDPRVAAAVYGPGGVVDILKPGELHHHDLHDQEVRNHHDRKKPFRRIRLKVQGKVVVESEIQANAEFLAYAARPGMLQVVIVSNHDEALIRWIEDTDWKADEHNAQFYLACAKRCVDAEEEEEDDFHLLEWACKAKGAPEDVVFLRSDQSWKVHGIECGLHGDKGPNGARGSARSISRMGSKTNIGHSHSATIHEGCWQTGVTAGALEHLDMSYNVGPSSWSRTMVVTYTNGKRSMLTMRSLKPWAERPGRPLPAATKDDAAAA